MAEATVLDQPEPEAKPRRWWTALLLSLFQPGVGQLYNGEAGKALAFFVLPFLFLAWFVATALRPFPFALSMLLVALAVLVQIGAAAEAAWTAGRRGPAMRRRRYDHWYVYAMALALSWLLVFSAVRISRRFVQTFGIPSHAMERTLLAGDDVLVDKARFREVDPRRGDIVVCRSPENPRIRIIQRIVGVGGDRIEIRNKALLVDSRELREPYAFHRDPQVYSRTEVSDLSRVRDNFGPYVVPEGQLFLLGDNRDDSYDSRFIGTVPRSFVEGGGRIRVYWSRNPTTGEVRWDRIGRFLR